MSISPTSPAHVQQQFEDSDLLILDGGPCAVGLESTIVGLLPGEPPRLLREGMLSASQIEAVLGEPLARGEAGELRVPGQHHRHYAPGTPTQRFQQAPSSAQQDSRCAWLWCGDAQPSAGPALNLGNDPEALCPGSVCGPLRAGQPGARPPADPDPARGRGLGCGARPPGPRQPTAGLIRPPDDWPPAGGHRDARPPAPVRRWPYPRRHRPPGCHPRCGTGATAGH